ncbi:MAG: NAD(P)H-dependent oxidoreductase [Candidatus Saliniplasma sp.]
MKIVVINGSPKIDKSITLHYVKYLEKKYPRYNFIKHHVGRKIKSILNDKKTFESVLKDVSRSDGVIWSVPVYTCTVPSQLMFFIEHIFEEGHEDVFEGKYCTSITTSAKFYDHTAHNYLKASSEDMGMKYVDGFSAEMYDMLKEDKRKDFQKFAEIFFKYIQDNAKTSKEFIQVQKSDFSYEPGDIIKLSKKRDDYNIILISDHTDNDENLKRMIDVFVKSMKYKVKVYNLHDIEVKGGCLGCVKCVDTASCIYKDDHEVFYEKYIKPADAVIYATKIKNRSFPAIWEQFYDRSFYNGHCPRTMGQQLGYIISGPLKQNPNIKEILKARTEMGLTNLVGIITDEAEDSDLITDQIRQFSRDFSWSLENDFMRPCTFRREGGHKIFRDLIYEMKFVFTKDHKFYKKHDLYDYPQKKYKTRIKNFFLKILLNAPGIKEKARAKMTEYMIIPLEEVIDEA